MHAIKASDIFNAQANFTKKDVKELVAVLAKRTLWLKQLQTKL